MDTLYPALVVRVWHGNLSPPEAIVPNEWYSKGTDQGLTFVCNEFKLFVIEIPVAGFSRNVANNLAIFH